MKVSYYPGCSLEATARDYRESLEKGTVFDLVDQAVDFVLSKINPAVGTREHSTQAPVAYEMPQEVVREAIVNAVAHRDYTSNGSLQVMLFADRLEVWNPGTGSGLHWNDPSRQTPEPPAKIPALFLSCQWTQFQLTDRDLQYFELSA